MAKNTSVIIGEQGPYQAVELRIVHAQNNSTTYKYVGEIGKIISKFATATYGVKWSESVNGTDIVKMDVVSATMTRLDGGMAELTVNCSQQGEADTNGEPKPDYECSMAEVKQPLAFHPKFPTDYLKQWQLFLGSPARVQCQMKYLEDPDNPNITQSDLDDSLKEWAKLYNKGITDYSTYLPIVTQVKKYTYQPTPTNTGQIGDPPQYSTLASAWLKTADNISFDGASRTWTRVEQWTGAHEWPETLYKNSNS